MKSLQCVSPGLTSDELAVDLLAEAGAEVHCEQAEQPMRRQIVGYNRPREAPGESEEACQRELPVSNCDDVKHEVADRSNNVHEWIGLPCFPRRILELWRSCC